LKSETPADPERLRATLMRRVADRLALTPACPARTCLRNRHCNATGGSDPACRHVAGPADRARFDQLFGTVESIRNHTLWPEPSRSDELRADEALAIEILIAALPLMPDFAPKFENWLARYNKWPTGPRDGRFWLKLAKEEIARCRAAEQERR
jgi:hypothetical protein